MHAQVLFTASIVCVGVCFGLSSMVFISWIHTCLLSAQTYDALAVSVGRKSIDAADTWYVSIKRQGTSLLQFWLRNGVDIFRPLARRLQGIPFVRTFVDSCVVLLHARSFETQAAFFTECILGLIVAVFAGTIVLLRSFMAAVLIVGCTLCIAYIVVKTKQESYMSRIKQDLPEALRILASACNASLSLPQAFEAVALELNGPLRLTFKHVVNDLHLGYSVSDALLRLQRRSNLPELSFLAVALDVQYIAGGSLVEVINQAQHAIDRSISLQRQLRIQTAQARLSARVVSIMPFLIMGAIAIISPGFLTPLVSSSVGFGVLGIAILLEVAGVIVVRRILDIPEAHI